MTEKATIWRRLRYEIVRRTDDYTGTVTWLNVATGGEVTLALTQPIKGPVSDLVGALRAMTISLLRVSKDDDAEPAPTNSAEIEPTKRVLN